MKKITTLAAIACLGISTMVAQTQRTILYEEFTGENCGPCAATNPGVNTTINPNFPNKILLIRYQCNIPSAPGAGSLYQDNPGEEGIRQTYYSVPFAPYARFNGIELPDLSGGGNNGHAGLITQQYITDSAIVNAPFGITVNHAFNGAADSITINVTVTAAMAYNSTTLKLQVSLGESAIHFLAPTGSNGEKDFYHIMRKMIPNAGGTTLQTAWTNGGTQSFTLKVPVPTYIHDKSKIEIVAFVEEQRTGATVRRVHNAAYSAPKQFAYDASASAISNIPSLQCATTLNPVATIANTGTVTITSCTVNYKVDAGTPASTTFNGSMAPGATATVSIPAVTVTAGTHTLYVYTSMPNGNTDINPNNDQTKAIFSIIGAAINMPVAEPFTSATYPPPNWTVVDNDHDNITWTRVAGTTGSASGGGASRCYFYASPAGNIDELYLPYNSFGPTPALTFYVASAPYTAGTPEPDQLDFMISSDCGATWSTLYSKVGATLNTTAAATASFLPTTAAMWRMETVNVTSFANTSNLLMKFKGTSGYGNNVWVDDVNLTGAVGIKTNNSNVLFSTVYPNPAQNSTNLLINLKQGETVKIAIVNMLGETVFVDSKNMNTGDNNIILNTSVLANGLYNILIATSEGNVVHKLTVNN
ncbi:MAG TPA: T9SS type A sorting domain-containing protein [Bacteroidia bacterium]|jgi:hypothetical protein|nr:T9SS type A sorting domain-containing protein [Bacteroidia bacterium]